MKQPPRIRIPTCTARFSWILWRFWWWFHGWCHVFSWICYVWWSFHGFLSGLIMVSWDLIGFNGKFLGFGAVQGILCNLEDHGSGYVSSVSENVMIKPSKIACRHFFTWLESHWLLVDSVIFGGWWHSHAGFSQNVACHSTKKRSAPCGSSSYVWNFFPHVPPKKHLDRVNINNHQLSSKTIIGYPVFLDVEEWTINNHPHLSDLSTLLPNQIQSDKA